MIVDTSAVVAIFYDEPMAKAFKEALAANPTPAAITAATFAELTIVLSDDLSVTQVQELLDSLRIRVEPLSLAAAAHAASGLRTYGKGRGHPAQLNLGDAFSYGACLATGAPLLFRGNDFSQVPVIEPAIAATG